MSFGLAAATLEFKDEELYIGRANCNRNNRVLSGQ